MRSRPLSLGATLGVLALAALLAGPAGPLYAAAPTPHATRHAAPAASSPRASSVRDRLAALAARIRTLLRQNGRDTRERARLDAQLASAERARAAARARLADTTRQIADAEARQRVLTAQRAQAAEALASSRKRLADALRAAYQLSFDGPLKRLLDQASPLEGERLATYYGYFGRALAARIADLKAEVQSVDALDAQLAGERDRLASLHESQQQELQTLTDAQQRRRATLASLTTRVASRDQQLAGLKQQRAELSRLVRRLAQQHRAPSAPRGSSPFAQLRGRLDWPVGGRVLAQYGAPRASGVPWDGELIATARGTPVHAVARGRVAYADWLPGLGLLIIIDHGGGYLSLYGHNQRLYKAAGQNVEAGEIIATAGDTGGRADPALYFEIRRNGDPIDPRPWFRAAQPPAP